MADNATYTLSVLLKLNDQLSGKLGKSVSALKGFKKETDSAFKSYEKLRASIAKPLAPPKTKGILPDLDKAAKVAGQMGAKNVADAARVLKFKREEAKLATDETRAAREQGRLAVDAVSHTLRLKREEARLDQQQAHTRRANYKASGEAEISDLRLARERIRLQREADRYNGGRRSGFAERVSNVGARADNVRNAAYSFKAAFDATKQIVDPALEQMRSEARFRMMGFSARETTGGLAAVDQALKTVKGVKRAEVIETLTALTGTFGDVEQASQFLPIASRYMANMKALQGDQAGPAEVARQIQNTFKSLELLGVDRPTGPRDDAGQRTFTPEDRARMEHYFDLIAQASAATGGDINPAEFRNFTKYARMAGQGITPEGMTKLLPLIPQMGGAPLGTALMSLSTNLVGGTLPAYRVREWDRLGLVRHKDDKGQPLVEYSKNEEIKRMRPGAIPMADILLKDPVAFADTLAAHLKTKGIDTSSFDSTNRQLFAMFGNRTSSGVMSQMINFRESLRKEASNYERVPSINTAYQQLFESQNPIANILDVQAKWHDAQARAGMKVAGAEGGAAGKAAELMLAHPDLAAGLAGVKALGTASTEAASGVGSLSQALSGLKGLGGGGRAGAGGSGIGGTGIDVSDTLAAGWGVGKFLRWGGRGLLAAGGAVGGAAASPYVAAALAATAGGIGLYTRHRAGKANEGADSAAQGLFESARQLREQSGGRLPDDIAKSYGTTSFMRLNRSGDLTTKLDPGFYGAYQRAYDPSPLRGWASSYDPARAPGVFRQRAPELAFPEVMRSFLADLQRRVGSGQISQAAGERTVQAAQATWPESFKAATTDAASALAKLPAPLEQAGRALAEMQRPAEALPGSLSRLGGSLDSLAFRIEGMKIEPPTFNYPSPVPPGGAAPQRQGNRFLAPYDPFSLFAPPKSAVGSVVQRDGLVSAHRGNVVMPARLSRRQPGDWLDALTAAGRGASSYDGDDGVALRIDAPVEININGAGDPAAVAAEVRAEMQQHRAQLEDLISRRTDRRRLERVLGHRKGIWKEKAKVA